MLLMLQLTIVVIMDSENNSVVECDDNDKIDDSDDA